MQVAHVWDFLANGMYWCVTNVTDWMLHHASKTSPYHPDAVYDWKTESGCDHVGIHVDYHHR